MRTLIHPSYTVVADAVCYICSLPVPVNVYRGTVCEGTNGLSLRMVRCLPAYGEFPAEIAEHAMHSHCSSLASGYEWTPARREQAAHAIQLMLSAPLEKNWQLRVGAFCLAAGCAHIATAGAYLQYCTAHARS